MEIKPSTWFVLTLILLVSSLSKKQGEVAAFDYFQLVIQYQPNVCNSTKNNCVNPPSDRFSIHGLWPSTYSGASVPCYGAPYVPVTSQQRNQLDIYWPDVINGRNEEFWEHEWNAHGTCSGFGNIQYFDAALMVGMRMSAMLSSTIRPTHTPVQRSQMKHAIKVAVTQKYVSLRCNDNKYTKSAQLAEIVICVDRNFPPNLENCGLKASSICPAMFTF